MTTSSSKDQCEAVRLTLEAIYSSKPYFKKVVLQNDDAGFYVELRCHRSALPEEGAPKVAVVDGVRVCVAVHG